MKVEINSTAVKDRPAIQFGSRTVMVTPPISSEYWLYRVPLSSEQAVVAFPKFGTIGIGFQEEEDWNCNLPYECSAEEIYEHIEDNKGDDSITAGDCIEAIKLLQQTIEARGE